MVNKIAIAVMRIGWPRATFRLRGTAGRKEEARCNQELKPSPLPNETLRS
jgi:hypothetical protein